jgi:hypothetical protein
MSPLAVPSASLPPDLSKLNVSQLKAICKERRIVGYSKLGKAALICKLSEVVVPRSPPCSVSTRKTASNTENGSLFLFVRLTWSQLTIILALVATQVARAIPVPQVVDLRTCAAVPDAHTSPGSTATQSPAVVPASQQAFDTQTAPITNNYTPPSLAAPGSISKRLPSETSHGQVPATQLVKKRKIVNFSSSTTSTTVPMSRGSTSAAPAKAPGLLISPVVPVIPALPVSCGRAPSLEQAGVRNLVRTQTRDTSGIRFKPLKVMRPAVATSGDVDYAQTTLGLHGEEGARTRAQLTNIRYQYLDFPAATVPPALSPITLPPSLTERRLVQRWAIILRGLSDKERFRCCFVSKLIRYAGKRRLSQILEYMHTHPWQCTHRLTMSSAKTSLGSACHLCCDSMAHLPL